MRCDKCGVSLQIGEYPFCPHGFSSLATVGDDIPGGQWIENLGHEPVLFYSKKAILAEADRRGLRLRDKWAGPSDKYLTNWAAGMTEKQLRDAEVLLSRGPRTTADDPGVTLQTASFSVQELKALPCS